MSCIYTGQVYSIALQGEVRLAIEEDGLTLTAPLGAYHLPYSDMAALQAQDYRIRIQTQAGAFLFSRLGNAYEAFYESLYSSYNDKVRKALFVKEMPLFTSQGAYRYDEASIPAMGAARIEAYANCVLLLPPDMGARRIPLCFVSAMEADDFQLTLRLETGETYTFSRLGYDMHPFASCIRECLRALREKALCAVRELDGSLSTPQQAAIAALMIEGAAAPLYRLYEISPAFVSALEGRVAKSRAAKEYLTFKEMSDPFQICVGLKSGLAGEESENIPWLIVPGAKKGTAAVELALSEETAAATFLYSFPGSFENFWRRLNQAMEAIAFARQVIRISPEELQSAAYIDQNMAVRRNTALQFIRSCYRGRAIHASQARWQQDLLAHMGSNMQTHAGANTCIEEADKHIP